MKLALYDIGTNSIHLVVIRVREDMTFEVLTHEKDMTRLGEGSFQSKRLAARPMRRALDVLERFSKIARKTRVDESIVVATSAVRDAKNANFFVRAVNQKTGLKVRVISGEEEARLIFLAAVSSVETYGKKVLAVDIGGGSMELTLGNKRGIHFIRSYPLGTARLTNLFLHKDPPSKKELKRLEAYLHHELKESLKKIRKIGFDYVVGTSGTMINLAAMISHERDGRPLPFVNEFKMRRADIDRIEKKLIRLNNAERRALPGLDPKRADIITGGAVLVRLLTHELGVKSVTLSDWGIREGMAIDYIKNHKQDFTGGRKGASLRENSVLNFGRRYLLEEKHAKRRKDKKDSKSRK